MVKGILFSIICVYVQSPVRSQTANPLPFKVLSAYELSVLALLVLISLFCTITVIGVLFLFRKLDKIWMKLSQKETPYEYMNHHAEQQASGASAPQWETKTTPTDSQAPTRVSSLRLPPDQKQEFVHSQVTPSLCQSPFRTKSPPDYEDTISRQARLSRVPRSGSLKSPIAAVGVLCGDGQSHYMEMKPCTISSFSTSPGLLRYVSSTQTPPSLRGSKHSRLYSDPSSYPVPSTGPVQAAAHSETIACPWNGRPESVSQSTANSKSSSITHQMS